MYDKETIKIATMLLEAIRKADPDRSFNVCTALFDLIFGKRFSDELKSNGILRYNSLAGGEDNIKYFGILYEGAAKSGPYENFSLVAFPFPEAQKSTNQLLLSFGIGTAGVTDDASWLATPNVKRSIKSLLQLSKMNGQIVPKSYTFIKDDIMDETSSIPSQSIAKFGDFETYRGLWQRYGKFLPSVCIIEANQNGAICFLNHLLLYGDFRNWNLKKHFRDIVDSKLKPDLISIWRTYPDVEGLSEYLLSRRFVILQGPPGTGKTHMAINRIAKHLISKGTIGTSSTIQFYGSYGYENFIIGYQPSLSEKGDLAFRKVEGHLLKSIQQAENSKGHLLIIDEINRGDLSRIMGESIFLIEPDQKRTITLSTGDEVTLPINLFILGTMNTADRSIAILDYAIRRRFAFIDIWPSYKELELILNEQKSECSDICLRSFNLLQDIFYEYADENDLSLQPGHTYFISKDKKQFFYRMKNEIFPLLQEYLNEGRLSLAKNHLHAYMENLFAE